MGFKPQFKREVALRYSFLWKASLIKDRWKRRLDEVGKPFFEARKEKIPDKKGKSGDKSGKK